MKFTSILRELFKLEALPPKGRLHCVECERRVRRHDKYRILAVQHVSCTDPRHVGQQSLDIPPAKDNQ
jgi:hypothetical protein